MFDNKNKNNPENQKNDLLQSGPEEKIDENDFN
jgi:hypothetical protein